MASTLPLRRSHTLAAEFVAAPPNCIVLYYTFDGTFKSDGAGDGTGPNRDAPAGTGSVSYMGVVALPFSGIKFTLAGTKGSQATYDDGEQHTYGVVTNVPGFEAIVEYAGLGDFGAGRQGESCCDRQHLFAAIR